MNRILGIAVLLALTSVVWGQTAGNPFDLKYRTPKPASTPTQTPEVIRPDTLVQPMPQNPIPESYSRDTLASIEVTHDTSASSKSDSFLSTNGINPFDAGKGRDAPPEIGSGIPDTLKANPDTEKILAPLSRKKAPRGFQIFFVLLSLLLLIFIVNVERSFVRDLWRVISNENYSSLHHRNQRNTMRQILLMMGYTIFVIQAGLFLYQATRIFGHSGALVSSMWVAIGLVTGVYLVRHGIIRYLRWLFNNEKELTLFGFDISIFNTMVGLVLLPLNVLLIFGPENIHKPLVIIGIVAISVAYLLRQLRWVLTSGQLIANSLFLFFVYLCTVEILPLWAVSKLFW